MRKYVVTGLLAAGLLGAALPGSARETGIVLKNRSFRLELRQDGTASSLQVEGRECLGGERIPFCTLTQERPYDNENFLNAGSFILDLFFYYRSGVVQLKFT